jgi:UDP-N-acetylglucosamine 4-epimerase
MLRIFYQKALLMESYNRKYHNDDISSNSYLITGGAGFIGSNIVKYLVKYQAKKIIVLDNLSTGSFQNVQEFDSLENFEFILGDIRDFELCKSIVSKVDFVSHQAALGSVPRSIQNPEITNEVNVNGFLNILHAVKEQPNIKRMVYAASSSTYGDSCELPKIEGFEGRPLSPYAVTKAVNEMYADVYSKVFNLHTIGLRYFNVFGPNQIQDNPYAAVIPIFCKAALENGVIKIHGDGETSRDFTYVENAVQANILAMHNREIKVHDVFNIACGEMTSLNEIVSILNSYMKAEIEIKFLPERIGDIKHSLADINKSKVNLGYLPYVHFLEGFEKTFLYYKEIISK